MKACAAGVALELPSDVLSEPDLSRILSVKTCAPRESSERARRSRTACFPLRDGSRVTVECGLRCGVEDQAKP